MQRKVSKTGIFTILPRTEEMKRIDGSEVIQRDYPDYLKDESNVYGGKVDTLFFPLTINHICSILKEATQMKKPVTVSGGRTGICAGAVPTFGCFVVSLEKMTKIINLECVFGEYRLKVESGIRLSELSAALRTKEFGITNSATEALRNSKKQYFYPPDPTETTATLGGTVATNASGARTLYYGPTRKYIVGLEVILPSGELLKVERGDIYEEDGVFTVQRESGRPLIIPAPSYEIPKTKHSAGLYSKKSMDLIDLFIGSEGILGIIATVTVRLVEEPPAIFGGVAFFKDEGAALDFVDGARSDAFRPLALEYFDRDALLLLDQTRMEQGPTSEIPTIFEFGAAIYFESTCCNIERGTAPLKEMLLQWEKLIESVGGSSSVAWGALNKRDLLRLKVLRHAVPETINKIVAQNKLKNERIHKVGTDMAVPDKHLKEIFGYYRSMLKGEKLQSVIFGHVGNNHLHVNMLPRTDDELFRAKSLYQSFAKKAVHLGGSVSAEHGIGKLKKDYLLLQYPKEYIAEMQVIKKTLDSRGILNPGTML